MMDMSRRDLLSLGLVAAGSGMLSSSSWAAEQESPDFAGLSFLRPGDTGAGGMEFLK